MMLENGFFSTKRMYAVEKASLSNSMPMTAALLRKSGFSFMTYLIRRFLLYCVFGEERGYITYM